MSTKQMPLEPEWLKASVSGKPVGVDRDAGEAGVLFGYIMAQEGVFKSQGRGEFDKAALREIVKLTKAAPNGLKSRFTHPSMTSDGLGKLLGRVRNPRLDKISTRESDGQRLDNEITVVRADLHLSPTSRNTPSGDLGGYVMALAENDPDALSSSVVITADEEYRIDKQGRPARDEDGNTLPPLWRPLRLHASDIVDIGDACDGLLSVGGLPDKLVRQASTLLDEQFAGQRRKTVEVRATAWLKRYLDHRFGAKAITARPKPRPKSWLEKFGPSIVETDPARLRELLAARRIEWAQTEGVTAVYIHAGDAGFDLSAVRGELRKVPLAIRRHWFNRGGRVEVIACQYTTDHREWLSIRDEYTHGFSTGTLAVVNCRFWPLRGRLTVLHEFAHALDALYRFPSDEPAWQYAAERDRDHGRISDEWLSGYGTLKFREEYFADQFARYYHSAETHDAMSGPSQRYLEHFEKRFESRPSVDAVA